ncbi:MAG: trimethylamine methyltransferase family protein, partial [Anaerolineae bacterium]
MGRLSLHVLSEVEIERIHQRSLDVLEQAGVRVLDAECQRVLTSAGARLDEASDLIDAAIRVGGSTCAYLFNTRGLIYWKMGRIDEAKRNFLEAIDLDSENGDPHFNIGLI